MKDFNAELAEFASSFSSEPIIPPSRKIPSNPTAIEAYFRETLLEIAEKPAEFYQQNLRFKEDFGLDSLDMVELIMYCENDLELNLKRFEWRNCKTAGAMLNLLVSRCRIPA